MAVFSGRTILDSEKNNLLSDLWSSLFIVVPSVSTTFASVERMLGNIPQESIGWLLIDEAGQALPQAAVGALMRTKRAIVVGDPLQIEPVVILPDTLTQTIFKHFGVEPNRFNAPEASAQTLSDAATHYFGEFDGKYGSRSVGVPLLVHRRCSEPMFSISNAVAYERLMVQAKKSTDSQIKNCLGDSRWINVQGQGHDKWCPKEGEEVLSLLHRLKSASITPDIYIVTPFVIVAENLRRIIRDSGILQTWTSDISQWLYERVGTVHTVQGREAEAVIFVLGAPESRQTGARGWAGAKPNLLNVAVTRAKEVLYVIGNKELWRNAGLFRELSERLTSIS
jgi:superfamily I DNA and/or RNA helicase